MDKKELSRLFSAIAPKYNLLNHLLSLNMDRRWRKTLVEWARVKPGEKILDVCTGTGDIALEFAKKVLCKEIVAIDISEKMLLMAKQKGKKIKLQKEIVFLLGDGLCLPFRDETFDIATISFGLRNLSNYQKGLAEMGRILKPGGRLLILEFSPPEETSFSTLYQLYLSKFVPLLGRIISGSEEAYTYLSSSIQGFLKEEEILKLMSSNQLKNLFSKKLTGGIVSLYGGER
ncbi:MAG: bifunctional demethylmenaquinone methyltransferase/2-methoxy-6-polyprenyl-1,4-benzoquinol methylase UbiE [bacterium]